METSESLWVSSGRGGHPSLYAGVFGWASHPVQGMLVSKLIVARGGIMRVVGARTQAFPRLLILQLNHHTFSSHLFLQTVQSALTASSVGAVCEQSCASNMLKSSVVVGALSLAGWGCPSHYRSCHYLAGVGSRTVP